MINASIIRINSFELNEVTRPLWCLNSQMATLTDLQLVPNINE